MKYEFLPAQILILVGIVLFMLLFLPIVLKYFRRRCSKRYRWPIQINFKNLKIKGDIMEFQLHEDQVLPYRIGKPINSDGEEAPIQDGTLTVKSSDDAIFTSEQDDQNPDDPEARMIVPHAEGKADLIIEADADLGEGVETIELVVNGTIVSGAATGFGPVIFGTPRKKTPPPTT